jgi:hypothetical protein
VTLLQALDLIAPALDLDMTKKILDEAKREAASLTGCNRMEREAGIHSLEQAITKRRKRA